jgi:prevent-host-death family protein
MTTTAEISELTGQLAELVKQVQAGNEALLTEGNRPVARLVPALGQSIGRCLANSSKSVSVVRMRIPWRTATAQISKSMAVPWTPWHDHRAPRICL